MNNVFFNRKICEFVDFFCNIIFLYFQHVFVGNS